MTSESKENRVYGRFSFPWPWAKQRSRFFFPDHENTKLKIPHQADGQPIILSAGLWVGCAGRDRPGALPRPARHRVSRRPARPASTAGSSTPRAASRLPGAIVQASWAFETGRGLVAPAGGAVTTVATDNDGHYFIDRLADLPSARARVIGVTIVVYQRGYVAYRSDRVFDNALGGARARTDFAQQQQPGQARSLDQRAVARQARALRRRLGPAQARARQRGGRGEPGADARARRKPGRAPPPSRAQAPPLDAERPALRSTSCAPSPATRRPHRRAAGRSADDADLRQPPLQGGRQARDLRRRAARLEAVAGRRRRALRQAARPRCRTPSARTRSAISSLRGFDGRIVAVAAVDHAHGVVIELTCGLDQCRDADQAAALLRRVLGARRSAGAAAVTPRRPKRPSRPSPPPSRGRPRRRSRRRARQPPAEPEPEDNQFKLKAAGAQAMKRRRPIRSPSSRWSRSRPRRRRTPITRPRTRG